MPQKKDLADLAVMFFNEHDRGRSALIRPVKKGGRPVVQIIKRWVGILVFLVYGVFEESGTLTYADELTKFGGRFLTVIGINDDILSQQLQEFGK